jgi:hypothetical protein
VANEAIKPMHFVRQIPGSGNTREKSELFTAASFEISLGMIFPFVSELWFNKVFPGGVPAKVAISVAHCVWTGKWSIDVTGSKRLDFTDGFCAADVGIR